MFSPYGHAISPTKSRNAISELESVYQIDQGTWDHPDRWNFLTRDKAIESAATGRSLVDPKVAGKKDPFLPDRKMMPRFSADETCRKVRAAHTRLIADLNALLGLKVNDLDELQESLSDFAIGASDPKDREKAAYLRSEIEIFSKFTLQRYVPPFWYLTPSKASTKRVTNSQLQTWDALCAWFRREYSQGRGLITVSDLSDPLDTNAGAPFFKTGVDRANHYLDGRMPYVRRFASVFRPIGGLVSVPDSNLSVPSKVLENLQHIADTLGIETRAVLAMGVSRRFGPSRKPFPLWYSDGMSVLSDREAANTPRARIVYMAPWVLNLGLSHALSVSKAIRKRIVGWWHDDEGVSKVNKVVTSMRQPSIIESDVSGLDTTMTRAHRRAIVDFWISLLPDHSTVAALLRGHADFSVIIPDFSDQSTLSTSFLMLTPRVDAGLYSGLKITSEIDSFYVYWASIHALRVAGLITLSEIESGQFFNKVLIENQGDDIRITADHKDILKLLPIWEDVYSTFGLKARMAAGTRFLMRHKFPQHKVQSAPVFARILQQTISREDPPDSADLFTLGIAARCQGLSQLKVLESGSSALAKAVSAYHELMTALLTDLMSDIPLEIRQLASLTCSDDARRKISNAISLRLASQDLMSIADYVSKNRFSASGTELIRMIEAFDLTKIKDAIATSSAIADKLFIYSRTKIGF